MSHQPLAYLYPEFLESNEARPIRILAEYLEPLRRFKEQRVQDTVVFFGSARVDSRERAERALGTLRARGVREPDLNEEYERELKESRRAVEWARYYEDARELARLLTEWSLTLQSPNHRFVVPIGAGPGVQGGGARRRPRSRRQDDRVEHPPAIRAGREPIYHGRPAVRIPLFFHAQVL